MKQPLSSTGALVGAAFIMATSAIGPGFLTQTTVFTQQLGASFGFIILLSFLLDLGAQVNIWRVVTTTSLPAFSLANRVLPGLGWLLTLLLILGGFAFNIGNIAGAGLGISVATGLPASAGAILSAGLGLGLFWAREAGKALDWFARALGLLMIILTAWVAFHTRLDGWKVIQGTFMPDKIDAFALVTIVGGTVGGYISFAGAQRLLDAGIHGKEQAKAVTQSALKGIAIATIMRLLLFLAAFGVISAGAYIDPGNPPAAVFRAAAGELGYRFFGCVMWSAAITSVVGCTYTTISFVVAAMPVGKLLRQVFTSGFILLSLLVFLWFGKPVDLMVFAGAINGFILPLALAAVLIAGSNRDLMQGHRLPFYWQGLGWVVVLIMGAMAVMTWW